MIFTNLIVINKYLKFQPILHQSSDFIFESNNFDFDYLFDRMSK